MKYQIVKDSISTELQQLESLLAVPSVTLVAGETSVRLTVSSYPFLQHTRYRISVRYQFLY